MAAATRMSKREQEMLAQIATMQTQLATMMAMSGQRTVVQGKAQVGIRNVSSYTIGLVNSIQGEQGEIQLSPATFKGEDPNSVAVVSHQFWTLIRKGKLVQNGQIVRDDTVVSDASLIGPPDRPEDLPSHYEVNVVVDPFQWIEGREEAEIRQDISKMTSEPSLRRLAAAVDHVIWKIGDEKYRDHPERAKHAIRECPAKYRWVDEMVEERLEEINPVAKDRAGERETVANFRG